MEQAPREGGRGRVRGDTRLDRQGPQGCKFGEDKVHRTLEAIHVDGRWSRGWGLGEEERREVELGSGEAWENAHI